MVSGAMRSFYRLMLKSPFEVTEFKNIGDRYKVVLLSNYFGYEFFFSDRATLMADLVIWG